MQHRKISRSLAHAFTFLLVVTLITGTALGQSAKKSPKLPRGTYTVSFRPYTGEGFRLLPVLVTGVTSQTGEGIQVDKVEVENKSAQSVEKLRFTWYLSTQENPETVLYQGQTPLLEIPDAIKSGEMVEILFPVTSFAKAARLWNSNTATLNGKYVIQIGVSEVRFEDGSARTLLAKRKGKTPEAKFAKAMYHASPTSLAQPPDYCPNQSCEVSTVEGVPVGYSCVGATGQSCTNSANGQSCSSAICRREGTGPVRPPIQPIIP